MLSQKFGIKINFFTLSLSPSCILCPHSQVNQKSYKCKRSDFKIMTRRMPPTDLVGADVLVKTVEGFEKPWVPGKVVGVTTQDR